MKWKHWKPIAAVILFAVILCVAAYAAQVAETDKSERGITESEVPAAALATLKKLAGGAKITEFAEEVDDGHTFYEGSWQTRSGANMDVLVTQAGDLLEIEEQVPADKVPAAVLKVATKVAGSGTQLVLEKKTTILYEIKFMEGDRQHELLLTPDGRRVEEESEQGNSDEDEGDEDEDEDDNDEQDDDDEEDERDD